MFLTGVLTDIIELHYLSENRIKNDEFITCLNFERTVCTDEPFVFASQTKQVFYVQNSNEEN